LSEEELEKELEADIAEWGRIKSSKNEEDWIGYLRKFPNGRFAEIAQTRLARLLAETEKREIVGATTPAQSGATSASLTSIPRISNEAEYDALPKGTRYIDPNGNTRRKS
jgi:hypothetical protein